MLQDALNKVNEFKTKNLKKLRGLNNPLKKSAGNLTL